MSRFFKVSNSDSKVLYFHGSTGELFPISQNLEEFILICATLLWDDEEDPPQIKGPALGEKFCRMYGVEVEAS